MYKLTGGNQFLDVDLILTKAEIKEKMIVADLGCGSTGHFVFPAADMIGREGKVYAVDIMKTSLEVINRRVKQENYINIKPIWSDLEIFGATNIESNTLDAALLINTLYQSKKRVEIIRETNRMLKKGGKLVIVEWKNSVLPFGPPIEERVNPTLLKTGIQKLGLKFEDEFFAGQFHYGLIFVKI